MKYILVTSKSGLDLVEKVNKCLKYGYEPFGSLVIMDSLISSPLYIQPMTGLGMKLNDDDVLE